MRYVNVQPLQKFVEKYGIGQTIYLLKEMCQEAADNTKGSTSEYWTGVALVLHEAHEKMRR
jgi:hypothetical protein